MTIRKPDTPKELPGMKMSQQHVLQTASRDTLYLVGGASETDFGARCTMDFGYCCEDHI
jgi:hypothetical protein